MEVSKKPWAESQLSLGLDQEYRIANPGESLVLVPPLSPLNLPRVKRWICQPCSGKMPTQQDMVFRYWPLGVVFSEFWASLLVGQ